MPVIPTQAQLESNPAYVKEQQGDETIYREKPYEYARIAERGRQEKAQGHASYYVYQGGRLIEGGEGGDPLLTGRDDSGYRQERYEYTTRYSRDDQGRLITEKYDVESRAKGKYEELKLRSRDVEDERVFLSTATTKQQKANLEAQSQKAKAAQERQAALRKQGVYGAPPEDLRYASYTARQLRGPLTRVRQSYTTEEVPVEQEQRQEQAQPGMVQVQARDAQGTAKIKPEQRTGTLRAAPKMSPLTAFEVRTETYLARNEGSGSAMAAGLGYGAYRYVKGGVKGFISFFNPKTYVEAAKAAANPKDTFEAMQEVGPALRSDPGLLFEIGGELSGFGKASQVTAKAVRSVRQPQALGDSAAEINVRQTDAGSVAVVEGASKVKVGRRTYDVQTIGKEVTVNAPSGDRAVSVAKFQAEAGETIVQERAVSEIYKRDGGSMAVTNSLATVRQPRAGLRRAKAKVQKSTTGSLQTTVVQDGLATDVSASATLSTAPVKYSRVREMLGMVRNKLRKQSPQGVEIAVTKEVLKADDVTVAMSRSKTIQGQKAVDAFGRAYEQAKPKVRTDTTLPAVRPGPGEPAAGQGQLVVASSDLLTQGVQRTAKIAAKAEYMREPTPAVPFVQPPKVKQEQKTRQRVPAKPITKEKEPKAKARSVEITRSEVEIIPAQTPKIEQGARQRRRPATFARQGQEQRQEQVQAQAQMPAVEIVPVQDIGQRQAQRQRMRQASRTPPQSQRALPVPRGITREPKGGIFTAEVRRRGKFQSVGVFGSAEQAVEVASRIVDMSPAASFRVRGDQGAVAAASKRLLSYRPAKRQKNIFVERNRARINTAGEYTGITAKGLQALKFGRKKPFGR